MLCCHTPLGVPIALKIFTWGFYVLNPHLESDLRFDHSKHTSIYEFLLSGQQTSKKTCLRSFFQICSNLTKQTCAIQWQSLNKILLTSTFTRSLMNENGIGLSSPCLTSHLLKSIVSRVIRGGVPTNTDEAKF